MVDYNELRKKFPVKPGQAKRKAAIKAIAREYERKKAAIEGLKAPVMKKGIVFYAVVIIGLLMLGSLVLSATGKGGRERISRAQLDVRKSVDSLAVALGRYRYHVGEYPSTEEGLEQLAKSPVLRKGWNGPYIKKVVKDPWGHDYVYVRNGEAENPTLYSKGPDGLAGTTDDVLPEAKLFDEAFRDTTWTQGWMPYQLRGYVVAPDERTKKRVEEEVRQILNPVLPVEGETVLKDWTFAGRKATVKLPLSEKAQGSFVALRFGGVLVRTTVSLNGSEIAVREADDRDFELDVSKSVSFTSPNELMLSFADSEKDAKALFREVTLVVEDAEDRMVWDSLDIETVALSEEEAKLHIAYSTPVGEVENDLTLRNPIAWTPERPFVYTYKVCDKPHRYVIRTLLSKDDGHVMLNGQPLVVKGVLLDSDVGEEGMAFSATVLRRRLRMLKDMGANAVFVKRSDRLMQALCDETGLLCWEIAGREKAPREAELIGTFGASPSPDFWRLRAKWNDRAKTVRLLPHWSWDGKEGEPIDVVCCTSGDSAELYLNGDSQGRRTGDDLTWKVPYEAGELKVIAFKGETPIGEDVLVTAGSPYAVALSSDLEALADGEETVVTARVVDEDGRETPVADVEIRFAIEEDGVGHDAFQVPCPKEGKAVCIVRRTGGSGLPLVIKAESKGLRAGKLTLPRR